MPIGENRLVRFGPFQLDTQCGQLRKNGFGVKLQGQPVQILEILLEKPGELVTREELRQRLWSTDTFVDFDHSLNTAIKRLRQALGDDAEAPKYIETIPKRGYRFVAEVMPHGQGEMAPTPLPAADEAIGAFPSRLTGAAASELHKPRSFRVWKMLVWPFFGVIAVGGVYWATRPPPMPQVVTSHALTKTGLRKSLDYYEGVVTDGTTVYFQEIRPSHRAIMRVPASGGEASEVPVPSSESWSLRDISKDGSELLLEAADEKSNHPDAWIQPLPSGPPRLLIKNARYPVWTADGRGILFVRDQEPQRADSGNELWHANADGTNTRRAALFASLIRISVAPDDKHLRILDVRTKTVLETEMDGSKSHTVISKPAFGSYSPDGKYFFFAKREDGLHADLWVKPEQERWWQRSASIQKLTVGPLSIGTPAISKDGKHVYAVGREPHGELSVWDKGKNAFVPYLGGLSACFTDFSRDGQWVAYVSYPEGTLWRSRIDGSERRQVTTPPLNVLNPRWSPDGKLIAFWDAGGYWDAGGEGSRIYIVSADGGGPMLLETKGPMAMDPTWSPDGKSIAYSFDANRSASGGVWILDVTTQQSKEVPGSHGLWSPRWSPDGRYLAALGAETSGLWLFKFATQKWSDLGGSSPNWPSWSHDSNYVYFAQGRSWFSRISISDRRIEQIAPVTAFPSTSTIYSGWMGLSPDDRPVSTRDTGIEEIYAFDLEYR